MIQRKKVLIMPQSYTLESVFMRKYERGKPHKVFGNKLNQDFTADKINRQWCTHFTYLFLATYDVRYHCITIALDGRSVVASITERRITMHSCYSNTSEGIGIPATHQRRIGSTVSPGITIYIKGVR